MINHLKAPVREIKDDELLALLAQPETLEKGFRLLMQQYQERLYWHIRRIVTEHEDANDVIQNTFVKVYRSIGKFKGDSKLYTWLYRIATNESLTFLKKRQRTGTESLSSDENSWENRLEAESYYDGNDAQALLEKALLTLPDKQRVVFTMRYYEELSYQDMSDVLETSVGALKASYHHAVKKIEAFVRQHLQ